MEEEELLKERLHAITDKRRIQEEIVRKRAEIEEEKFKLQYLKKKILREKWLMDGLSIQNTQEQETIRKQTHEEQNQAELLQTNILRMEQEIKNLENQEIQISTNEELILKKLKEVEKSAKDIIKNANDDVKQDIIVSQPTEYVYSEIPDLPKSYRPSALKKLPKVAMENNEQAKRALFAMEINVEKDMKTGESQVLSASTVKADAFQEKGIKVYDDGRKSVYAISCDGEITDNGVQELTPAEVEELLRAATEKKSQFALEYHEPVFSSSYNRSSNPKKQNKEHVRSESNSPLASYGIVEKNMYTPVKSELHCNDSIHLQDDFEHSYSIPYGQALNHYSTHEHEEHESQVIHNNENILINDDKPCVEDSLEPTLFSYHGQRENHHAALFVNSHYNNGQSSLVNKGTECNILHTSSTFDCEEPVTMIFMGYQNVNDETDLNKEVGFEGAIRAELVVIGDDYDDIEGEVQLSYHPEGQLSKIYKPGINPKSNHHQTTSEINWNMNNQSHQKNVIPVNEQKLPLCHGPHHSLSGQMAKDSTDDPSMTELEMKMLKLCK
ncbi:palmdelphin-like [Polypterus senegalus]|uniref:palmdelphin-like n=1 Tax=Polypterus senegalus TaxID=55291 RepID=UPI001965D67A|nr:palmdelphin-like [Polypterus senegalus]XP_039591310.1 palmdelphin-like [Polypterus senegalus]